MEYRDILATISSKNTKPVYFLCGEEAYFIDQLVQLAEETLIDEGLQDFNLSILYGKDTVAKRIVETCRQYPLMGDKKVVIVKEGQDIKDKDWEGIEIYLKDPSPVCTLLIAYKYKKPDGRLAWSKLMKANSVFFESKELKDNQIPAFIIERAKENGMKIDQEACILFSEYIGNNLSQIVNEIDKIKLSIKSKETITVDHVKELIGVSKEFNVFELQKAFSLRDQKQIYYIAKNMGDHIKTNPLVMVIGALFNHFTKLWMVKNYNHKQDEELSGIIKLAFSSYIKEYRQGAQRYSMSALTASLSILKEFDLKSKGVNIANKNDKDLLLEMALELSRV